MLLVCLLLLGLAFWTWKWYLRSRWELQQGFMAYENGEFEIAKAHKFDGTRLQELDPHLLPGGKHDPKGKRRLVFVGDIHGCAKELKQLLQKVDFDEENDHLVAVGDVISKGPDHVGVVDELIRLGATSVRGNHEDRILAIAPSVLETNTPDASIMSKAAHKDRKIIHHLHKKHIRYLHDMPLMLRIPALPMADQPTHRSKSPIAEEIIVVHGGLVPAVSLDKQDPYFVMNMRAIKTKTHAPLADAATKKNKSKPWHEIWSFYNDRLFRKKSIKDWDLLQQAGEWQMVRATEQRQMAGSAGSCVWAPQQRRPPVAQVEQRIGHRLCCRREADSDGLGCKRQMEDTPCRLQGLQIEGLCVKRLGLLTNCELRFAFVWCWW